MRGRGGARLCGCVLESKRFSVLRFSLPDQLFHPRVQSAALADGSGRADTYVLPFDGGRGNKRSEGNGGTLEGGDGGWNMRMGGGAEGNPAEGEGGSERGG